MAVDTAGLCPDPDLVTFDIETSVTWPDHHLPGNLQAVPDAAGLVLASSESGSPCTLGWFGGHQTQLRPALTTTMRMFKLAEGIASRWKITEPQRR